MHLSLQTRHEILDLVDFEACLDEPKVQCFVWNYQYDLTDLIEIDH